MMIGTMKTDSAPRTQPGLTTDTPVRLTLASAASIIGSIIVFTDGGIMAWSDLQERIGKADEHYQDLKADITQIHSELQVQHDTLLKIDGDLNRPTHR